MDRGPCHDQIYRVLVDEGSARWQCLEYSDRPYRRKAASMIFQLILSTALFTVIVYSYGQRNNSLLVSSFAFLAALIGFYFTWLPSHANLVAAAVGVGRGADLIFYLWVIISLILLLNVHLKLRV